MKEISREETGDFAVSFLEGLMGAARLNLHVKEAQAGDEGVTLELHGADGGLVLANNGRVLYALEHVVNQALHRRGANQPKVRLDCNGYRSTRILELQLLARKAAERVRTTGTPLSLQPMPSAERRIIHLALAEEADVRTESSGAGLRRHVVILPGQ